jgi:hypothetical protein
MTTQHTGRQRGASLVEYALVVVLVAMGASVVLGMVGKRASARFDSALPTASTSATVAGGSAGSGGGGGGGGYGGGDGAGATTTVPPTTPPTTAPATTATTAPPATTATTAAAAHTATTLAAPTGLTASPASRAQWWDAWGKQGAWVSGATFHYASNRHAFLTVEVTLRYENGTSSTRTVDDFFVPAGGSATLETYDNPYSKAGKGNDVASATYTVTEVRTYDASWNEVVTAVSGPTVTANAPGLPN